MKMASRGVSRVCSAPFQMRHYIAAKNMLTLYTHPLDAYKRYITGTGEYPVTVNVKTPVRSYAAYVVLPGRSRHSK